MCVYLIQSSSIRLLNDQLEDIFSGSKNVSYFDLINSSLEDILEEASYFSLFDEFKYLVIKNADIFGSEKLKESQSDILNKYLDYPNPNTILIFTTSNKIDSRKAITKKIKEKYKVIVIDSLKSYEIEKRIEAHFKKRKYKYSKGMISYIVNITLANYDLVCNELEKIDLYYNKEDSLQMQDLEKIVSRVREENNFKLVDAIITRNISNSFNILNDLKLMKVEPTVLLTMIAREYRIMYQAKVLTQKGLDNKMIAKNLGLQDWQVDKYLRNAYEYSLEEIEEKLLELYESDKNLKSGIPNRYLPIELFIMNI